jgi:hypothetical protein
LQQELDEFGDLPRAQFLHFVAAADADSDQGTRQAGQEFFCFFSRMGGAVNHFPVVAPGYPDGGQDIKPGVEHHFPMPVLAAMVEEQGAQAIGQARHIGHDRRAHGNACPEGREEERQVGAQANHRIESAGAK